MGESDTSDLLAFVGAVSGEAYLKVEENLGHGFVRLLTSEAERRQAQHDIRLVEDIVVELLRNARDAHAQHVFVATSREGSSRLITMIDDGVGIPATHHETVFEPRVTSKLDTMVMDRWGVHGRGMALFSIRENVTDCRVMSSDLHRGTSISLSVDTEVLPERADQSTWPLVERDVSAGLSVIRGPHNIIRRVLEFAAEHPELEVYLGSPVEVASTLYSTARSLLGPSDLLFCDSPERLPVWQRPASAGDAADFVHIASSIGLPLSERTAHRILAGEVPSLDTVTLPYVTSDEP
ncbi:MAG TPA: ATP-binding protein, partial [Coriobacteriia bacterium]|nr:ATP-binding protein [Coriobacteriia bacterium]